MVGQKVNAGANGEKRVFVEDHMVIGEEWEAVRQATVQESVPPKAAHRYFVRLTYLVNAA
jgi:hypothetical protein